MTNSGTHDRQPHGTDPPSPGDRFLRLPAVLERTGMSRSWIFQAVKDERFPAPMRIGGRAIAWREQEVTCWLDARPRAALVPVAMPKRTEG